MSDNQKPTRTRQELQNEYTQLCAKAGNIQYQIYAFQLDLDQLNSVMRDINVEAQKLAVAEQEAAKAAAAEQPAETKAVENA